MMARSYESLMGALGRSVFYRPERRRVRELLSRDANPQLLVNGDQFPLFDVSMNGVSFLAHGVDRDWEVGDEIPLKEIRAEAVHGIIKLHQPAGVADHESERWISHVHDGMDECVFSQNARVQYI